MKTEIICVIDRSGSMVNIKDDAIGGFNTFLEDQQKDSENTTLTLVQFDHEYEMVYENIPLVDVPKLDKETFRPKGSTALLDAIGITIDSVGKRLSNIPEANRPDKIIFTILTDGEENSSWKFDLSKIKEMIQHQKEKYSWEFIFLAANQDAFAEAAKIGISPKDTFNFSATGAGIRSAYFKMLHSVSKYKI